MKNASIAGVFYYPDNALQVLPKLSRE